MEDSLNIVGLDTLNWSLSISLVVVAGSFIHYYYCYYYFVFQTSDNKNYEKTNLIYGLYYSG